MIDGKNIVLTLKMYWIRVPEAQTKIDDVSWGPFY